MASFEFICGKAGTGKSYIAVERAKGNPSIVLTATTGIAATNLGRGTTINSLLGYFDTASLQEAWLKGKLSTKLNQLAKAGINEIITDEMSMLCGEQLNILVWALDELNTRREKLGESTIGLTLVGDLVQLPPIEGKFAFESDHWGRFAANTTILNKIWRQDDTEFINALNEIRCGRFRKALDYFQDKLHTTTDDTFKGTTLYAVNTGVDRYNKLRVSRLGGDYITFKAYQWGEELEEWRKHIPTELKLKLGTLVMILSNRKDTFAPSDKWGQPFLYVNGDLGYFQGGDQTLAKVRLLRTGKTVAVIKANLENNTPDPDTDKMKRIGGISYLPLRAAYSCSVHKAQGLTLDNVQIDLRHENYKTPGMLYVALSRARTGAGLRLVGSPKLFAKRCKINEKVKPWI